MVFFLLYISLFSVFCSFFTFLFVCFLPNMFVTLFLIFVCLLINLSDNLYAFVFGYLFFILLLCFFFCMCVFIPLGGEKRSLSVKCPLNSFIFYLDLTLDPGDFCLIWKVGGRWWPTFFCAIIWFKLLIYIYIYI